MVDWHKLLERNGWLSEPVAQRGFEFDPHPLFAAAQALALASYPAESDQQTGGPSHRFCEALLADMFRLSKKKGKTKSLPKWASSLKASAMRSRLNRGCLRLSHTFAALQTIFEAEILEEERKASLEGARRTFTIRFSPDFGKLTINMPIKKVEGKFELIGSVPQTSSSSLRAAIISHREAFGKGHGDSQEEYVNIYNRHVRPIFPLLPLIMVIREALLSKAKEASERRLSACDILMLQPEWAENLVQKVHDRQGQAIWMMHNIGLRICACSMLEVSEQKSKF